MPGAPAWLLEARRERGAAVRQRLNDFRKVPPEEYFYELCYCLLTPQSSAAHAGAVIEELRRRNFRERPFNPEPLLRDPARYIRFHRTKTERLLNIRHVYPDIHPVLPGDAMPDVKRDALVAAVNGFGLKEATHFLRNIGKSGSLAILDRHILRMLVRCSVLDEMPGTLTPARYREIENRFQIFSDRIGIPMAELDLLFWSEGTGVILK